MCGISGYIGQSESTATLLTGLENLEYRGYDSAGLAVRGNNCVQVVKREGEVEELARALDDSDIEGTLGIGHTRWSTHGPPSDENAHPHTDCTGTVAVVHNGIIDNYDTLREQLRAKGHTFTSETDTEVIPHLVEEHLKTAESIEQAFRRSIRQLEGSYAIALVTEEDNAIYATRSGSPLVVGIGDDDFFLASDVPAFLEFTDEVVYLEDEDVVVLKENTLRITDLRGNELSREQQTVDWTPEDAEKRGYDHYMLKEIHEQPSALERTIEGRVLDGQRTPPDIEASGQKEASTSTTPSATASLRHEDSRVSSDGGEANTNDIGNAPTRNTTDKLGDSTNYDSVSDELSDELLQGIESVHFVACGTSYHAALYGEQLLANRGIQARSTLASEFVANPPPITTDTLVVGVTQSGETADTLEALRLAKSNDIRTLAVTNVVGSTAARECDDALFIRAGPEIGVAATKTFSSQIATLALLAAYLSPDENALASITDALAEIPSQVQHILEEDYARQLATQFQGSESYFFIGRGVAYPVALEGALKLKEISYEHAEGFPAGELKHGPLALVTPDTPVFAIVTGEHVDKMRGTIREVEARGAPVISVSPPELTPENTVAQLPIPQTHPELAGILANVQLQLFSYHTAKLLDRPVDKPRNLAKSVTVE